MTPEERKALAMQHHLGCSRYDGDAERHYPKCCAYHQGFDDALALLVPRTVNLANMEVDLYAIEDTP